MSPSGETSFYAGLQPKEGQYDDLTPMSSEYAVIN